jgi:hypothetical protein
MPAEKVSSPIFDSIIDVLFGIAPKRTKSRLASRHPPARKADWPPRL